MMIIITIIRELQIKTTGSYCLTLVRIAIIKKKKKKKKQKTSVGKDVEKSKPQCTAGGNENWFSYYRRLVKIGTATIANILEVSQKIKNRTTI